MGRFVNIHADVTILPQVTDKFLNNDQLKQLIVCITQAQHDCNFTYNDPGFQSMKGLNIRYF